MSLDNISCQKSFGGWHKRYRHHSRVLGCDMVFAVYLPPQAEQGEKLPVLYWLSGLTCTDENFMQKAGAQRLAAELGLIIVAPDTSPRGEQVPGDPDGAWDFGLGAGFYLNATQQPWAQHYRMHDYVVQELPALIEAHFRRPTSAASAATPWVAMARWCVPCATQGAIARCQHSRRSAIRWIARGAKAFSRYLGEDRARWREWDASVLLAEAPAGECPPLLVDQGDRDDFLEKQLKPEALEQAARKGGHALTLRLQPGYDHSYYFIASFIDEHLRHHAMALGRV